YIERTATEQIEKQIAIAEVPSSPFGEEARGKVLAEEFRRAGLQDVETDPAGNVLGLRRGRPERVLAIAAHFDTVFPPGTSFKVRREGARLVGPGLNDDTRGLIAILTIARALREAAIQTERTLLFVADVGEEGLGNLRGIKYLVGEGKYRGRIDAFISIDGDGTNAIAAKEMGSRRYRVTIRGPGGHSFGDYGRANPAGALGRIIAKLDQLRPPAAPKTTYNVGRIGGGTSINS